MKSEYSGPNPPYGERSNYRKVTLTVPPEAYSILIRESARRKIAEEPNHVISAILREALQEYFERLKSSNQDTSDSRAAFVSANI
jgi:transcriptional regulator of met regulon